VQPDTGISSDDPERQHHHHPASNFLNLICFDQ
jgi:hypothetical protein